MVKNKNKSTKPVIEIREMHKWFGTFHVLKNISLGVNQGERIVICGPSGSGKSTTARVITGLLPQSAGSVVFDGDALPERLADRTKEQKRRIQMIYQMADVAMKAGPRIKSGVTGLGWRYRVPSHVQALAHFLARLEAHEIPWWDVDDIARSRISGNPTISSFDLKHAKIPKLDPALFDECVYEGIEGGLNRFLSFRLWEV